MHLISVKTQFIGFHSWDNAPDEVSFLRNKHRHIFNVKLTLEVFTDDREVEFFLLQKDLNNFLEEIDIKNNMRSCEWLAKQIVLKFSYYKSKKERISYCEVSEDNENSGIFTNKTVI